MHIEIHDWFLVNYTLTQLLFFQCIYLSLDSSTFLLKELLSTVLLVFFSDENQYIIYIYRYIILYYCSIIPIIVVCRPDLYYSRGSCYVSCHPAAKLLWRIFLQKYMYVLIETENS